MSGTLQLLMHFGLAGMLIGFGISAFSDSHFIALVFGTLFLLAGYFHIADAAWVPSFGLGRDLVDRIGIAIKGMGFVMFALAVVLYPSLIGIFTGIVGFSIAMFGRIMWELAIVGRKA